MSRSNFWEWPCAVRSEAGKERRTADDLARPAAGTKGYDPTDLVSVVRVILH